MAVRIKRKLRGKDGGKHPHVKNIQDFPSENFTPEKRSLVSLYRHLDLFRNVLDRDAALRYQNTTGSDALYLAHLALERVWRELQERLGA